MKVSLILRKDGKVSNSLMSVPDNSTDEQIVEVIKSKDYYKGYIIEAFRFHTCNGFNNAICVATFKN